MTLLSMLAHAVVRRHTYHAQPGVGHFIVCSKRFGRTCRVKFSPDFEGAGWHRVPYVQDDGDGTMLFERMLRAENAWSAMAMLREVEAREEAR